MLRSAAHSVDPIKEAEQKIRKSMEALRASVTQDYDVSIFSLVLEHHVEILLDNVKHIPVFDGAPLLNFSTFDVFLIRFLESKPTIAKTTMALGHIKALIKTQRVEGVLDASVIGVLAYACEVSSVQLGSVQH